MGQEQSTEAGAPQADNGAPLVGFHVLQVVPNSPGGLAGVEAYFDFIVESNGRRLERDDKSFEAELSSKVGQAMSLLVYSARTETYRRVTVTPSNTWGGAGVLGLSIRFVDVEQATEHQWHVLDVYPNSPAAQAGLQPYVDFIVGAPEAIFTDEEDLYGLVAKETTISLYVYSAHTRQVRQVVLTPKYGWGGSGLLGCDIGYGLLHKIPRETAPAPAPQQTLPPPSHQGVHAHMHVTPQVAPQLVALATAPSPVTSTPPSPSPAPQPQPVFSPPPSLTPPPVSKAPVAPPPSQPPVDRGVAPLPQGHPFAPPSTPTPAPVSAPAPAPQPTPSPSLAPPPRGAAPPHSHPHSLAHPHGQPPAPARGTTGFAPVPTFASPSARPLSTFTPVVPSPSAPAPALSPAQITSPVVFAPAPSAPSPVPAPSPVYQPAPAPVQPAPSPAPATPFASPLASYTPLPRYTPLSAAARPPPPVFTSPLAQPRPATSPAAPAPAPVFAPAPQPYPAPVASSPARTAPAASEVPTDLFGESTPAQSNWPFS